jgi:hypothetical protein
MQTKTYTINKDYRELRVFWPLLPAKTVLKLGLDRAGLPLKGPSL